VIPNKNENTSNLASGSNPDVIPGPILVADEANNRLLLIDLYGNIL